MDGMSRTKQSGQESIRSDPENMSNKLKNSRFDHINEMITKQSSTRTFYEKTPGHKLKWEKKICKEPQLGQSEFQQNKAIIRKVIGNIIRARAINDELAILTF